MTNLLSLFVGNNLARGNFALNNEAFQIRRMKMPIPANAGDFTLPEFQAFGPSAFKFNYIRATVLFCENVFTKIKVQY
jgi:hypothetical protein